MRESLDMGADNNKCGDVVERASNGKEEQTSSGKQRFLDFYGYVVEIRWPESLSLDAFTKEFQYFESEPGETALRIILEPEDCKPHDYTFLRPAFSTPRNVCYQQPQQRIVNYHNEAMLFESYSSKEIRIRSQNHELLESILYTVLIAKSGEHFDKLSRFRIHALSVSFEQKAYLVLLPMGGGKSTLLLELLQDQRISLISEDTPLVDAQARVWPFPIKIGVLPGKIPSEIPAEMLAQVRHLEGVVKQVVDLSYLQGRIVQGAMPIAGIFVGIRYLGEGTQFVPLSYLQALRVAIRDCVVGLGVYQGLEFILNQSNWELLTRIGLGARRLYACGRIVAKVPCVEYRMGTNPSENAQALLQYLEQQ